MTRRKAKSEVRSALRKPKLSVIVVVYNIPREAPRTLYSLSAGYQREIDPDDYEVIVVDNGSDVPIDPTLVEDLAGNFRFLRIDPGRPSPAHAVNRGLAEARGEVIGVMIDGARIATPGLFHFGLHGVGLYENAVVATLGWYLGHDLQMWWSNSGYNHAREDALLDSIDWPNDGYRLFEIGTMDESSVDGWFQPIAESNALFLRRGLWEVIGGFDERFETPAGGFVNLDTFSRLLAWPNAELVILLGEATFHQLHGGTSTNAAPQRQGENSRRWSAEYLAIRGKPWAAPRPTRAPTYIGTLPPAALARIARAAVHPIRRDVAHPLGADFNRDLWTHTIPARSADETIAGLVDMARDNFFRGRFEACCAVARLIRERAPDDEGVRTILALVAPSVMHEGPPEAQRADHHLALAEAHRRLGEDELAASNYRTALTFNRDLPQAHLGLAELRMPGDDYLVWLDRLYQLLTPETSIQIGIGQGKSLIVLRPPTVAIGVDPNAVVLWPLQAETHIFAETSDEFFAQHHASKVLAGRPVGVAFVDGLHLYEQALKVFIGLEALCGPRSLLLMHDTVPLDEPTQTRVQETEFHTGDVWKIVLCLKHFRPDLDIFTIATAPTGLTVVSGLDPTSRVLSDNYDVAVARFLDTPFSAIEAIRDVVLNVVPNDWSAVRSRLEQRGII